MAASAATTAQKPYPIFTVDQFQIAMKTVGLAFGLVNSSLASNDVASSKDYLARSRDQLATTIVFWRDRKRDDAIKMLRDAVSRMDDLDVALSTEPVDPAAVTALAKQVGAACESCHAVYREQDPATKAYRLKPGVEP